MDHNKEYSAKYLADVLASVKTIAMVGASPDPTKFSYGVLRVLHEQGFEMFPINNKPEIKEIRGIKVFPTLDAVDQPVDMVQVFRKSEALYGVAEEAINIGAKVLWGQIGVYDNKAAKTVTKKDIEKAKKYQKIHGTDYVIIVSANLPKTSVPNGHYGTRDGILLVHPSLVTEVTKQIRTAIIEISKLRLSSKDQKSKQSQLYEYITSSEFSRIIEEFSTVYEKLYKLQSKEEKDHQTLWKSRNHEIDKLVKLSNDMGSGIESITQTSLDEIKVEAKK